MATQLIVPETATPSMSTAASWTALLGGPVAAPRQQRHPILIDVDDSADVTHDSFDDFQSDGDDGDDAATEAQRHHNRSLIDERPHPPDFDMRTLIGAVERVHLLRACSALPGASASPLVETTVVRLAHGAWVRAPYVRSTTPAPGRGARAHLCDLLARIYGPFWSHIARADTARQPAIAGRIGNPPTPVEVLRCLRRDFGLSRLEAARIKASAPDDPIGAADTIARIFCGLGVGMAGPTSMAAHETALAAAVAEGAAFVRAVAGSVPAVPTTPSFTPTVPPTVQSVPPRILLVGVASACPSSLPDGSPHANGTRFALVASRVPSSRPADGYVWRWAAWVLWDTRARTFWEASDETSMAAADAAVGEPPGRFAAWLRVAALRPGTALPTGVLTPRAPDACLPVDALLLEVTTLVTSRLVDPRIADAVRAGVARAIIGWAPLWDDQIAPHVRAVSTVPPRS
ncbi:hypothetical protein pmac_cds_56 [Pandoravirus macleodensis]|uniref:DUF5848 domain-containing protein n=1 Tax=Pandoravirus macleodensis TaxID=2107707 RepID=A0A2U7UE80_9VIRU|nr:hypothetical protein pmac_cds_56 [Pandoravirus macleodensis]AVK76744.1 hypothetical protein pmac_cds_56 [Pandoravirus macleodensis]